MRDLAAIGFSLAWVLFSSGCQSGDDWVHGFLGIEPPSASTDSTSNTDTLSQLSLAAFDNLTVSAESPIPEQAASAIYLGSKSLTYSCAYDTLNDGIVANTAPPCSMLADQSGGTATFDTTLGRLNWTPPFAAADTTVEFKITVSDGSLSASRVFSVSVLKPRPALDQSTLTLSASSVASGSSITLTFQGKSAAGTNLTYGGASVTFLTVGGTSTGTFGPTVDNNDGTYSSTFTGVISGSATTIKAAVSGFTVTSSAQSVTVTPGTLSLSNSSITLSSDTVQAGGTVLATLTARDGAGNSMGGTGLTVVFSNSGGSSTGSFAATNAAGNGVYTSVFTASASGNPTAVRATINGSLITSILPTLTVTPGAPFALAFTTQPTSSTSPTIVFPTQPVVSIVDAQGNAVTTGTAATATIVLTLTTLAGSGSLGGTTMMSAVAGVANYVGKGLNISANGSYKLTATASSLALTVDSSSIAITTTTPVISSNAPLNIAYVTNATGVTADTTGTATPTGTGTSAISAISTATSALISSTGSGVSAPASTSAPQYDQTNQSTPYQISVTSANTTNCTALAPFAGLSCNTSLFNLSYADIFAANTAAPNGFFQINDGFLSSNQLTVGKTAIAQVSNLANSQSGHDALDYETQKRSLAFNGKIYFNSSQTGAGMMSIDSSGTIKREARTSGGNDVVGSMALFNGSLYYASTNSGGNYRLYKLTTGGALTQINNVDVCGAQGLGAPTAQPVVHTAANRLYFVQKNGSGKCKLHYLDTSDAIYQVSDLQGSGTDDSIIHMNYFNGYIWFVALCQSGLTGCSAGAYVTYRIDAAGNLSLAMNLPNNGYAFAFVNSVVWNSKLYINYSTGTNALFSVDASDNLVRQTVNNLGGGTSYDGLHTLVPFNGKLYGSCLNSSNKTKLCSIDTSGTLTQISNTSGYATANDDPVPLGVLQQGGVDTELYFVALKNGLFKKLFKLDLAGAVHQLSDIQPGADDFMTAGEYTSFSLPSGASGANEFYFWAKNASNAGKLFKIYAVP